MHRLLRRIAARTPHGHDDKGFTLVGTLAAGTILSVVALSLVKAWVVFDGLSFDLLLRQKAVLVLGGEMERLWAVYTRTSYAVNDYARNDYPAIAGMANSATRYSYVSTTDTQGFLTSAAGTFTALATPDATVFLGTGSPPLNWVWLDRQRNLVARLSWRSCQFQLPDMHACFGVAASGKKNKQSGTPACYANGGNCEMLTLILDYPYAFNGGAPQAVGTTRTLTLTTVVGRRA